MTRTERPEVVLCIVGSMAKAWKDPEVDEVRIKNLIRVTVQLLVPDLIISGRCPSGGVDIWAEEEAARLGYTTMDGFRAYEARVHRFKGPGGYQERDLAMAEACTHLLAIRSMWSTTYGSGWTHDRARALGKVSVLIQF